MIVQGEDRFHVLPSTLFWCHTGSTFFCWTRNQMVYDTKTLGFCQVLAGYSVLGLFGRLGGSYAMKPILNPKEDVIGRALGAMEIFLYLDL